MHFYSGVDTRGLHIAKLHPYDGPDVAGADLGGGTEPRSRLGNRSMTLDRDEQREIETFIGNLRVNLAHHRQRLGWSQTTLAERAGISPQVISRLETGKYPAKKRGPLVTVKNLARVLSVTIEELVGPPFAKAPDALPETVTDSHASTSMSDASELPPRCQN